MHKANWHVCGFTLWPWPSLDSISNQLRDLVTAYQVEFCLLIQRGKVTKIRVNFDGKNGNKNRFPNLKKISPSLAQSHIERRKLKSLKGFPGGIQYSLVSTHPTDKLGYFINPDLLFDFNQLGQYLLSG